MTLIISTFGLVRLRWRVRSSVDLVVLRFTRRAIPVAMLQSTQLADLLFARLVEDDTTDLASLHCH